MKAIIIYLLGKFRAPFEENRTFLLVLLILSGAADLFFWTLHSFENPTISPYFGAYMYLHSFIEAYLIVFFCGFINGKRLKIAKALFILLGILNLCVDTGIHVVMKCGFIPDFVAIIMGTNTAETTEFLGMYLNKTMILFVVCVLCICLVVAIISKILQRTPSFLSYCGCVFFIICCIVVNIRRSNNWDGVFLLKIKTCLQYKKTPNMHEYSKEYKLVSSERHPEKVVLIMGESLNKGHMSLYGYEKNTTPLFDELSRTRNLIPFDNVTSSAVGTVPAFKLMMTSLKSGDNWDDYLFNDFLVDIIKAAGYDVRWISNQASAGIHDNFVARFAELSDSLIWCGTKFRGQSKQDYDEDVLEPTRERSQERDSLSFTIVHLCGNHESFKSRYPETFARFNALDYEDRKESQRQILSEYDNSVLYNDWIVNSIINMYKEKDAIIVYLPDHSLDIFDSSDDYAGHARSDEVSIKAGKNIPFIIYATDEYIERSPETFERFTNSIHNRFQTEDLMYAIMDIIGVEFADREPCVGKYSLFRNISG